ncbi:MAG: acyl transferase, partial [Chitinophagaceae bacterium]
YFEPQSLFTSSGTTTTINSHHYIKDVSIYKKSFIKAFEQFYGNIDEYCILGLLPSYLERTGSSLVMMVDELIKRSGHAQSGFYLYDFENLHQNLMQLEAAGQKTLLIGVTYALLDFAEQYPIALKNTIVMETGGMKGRKAEMVRSEVHDILKTQFQTRFIHSEYGMTELLSQAYSSGIGRFFTPAWMKILLRKEDDPFDISDNKKGVINVIDLANIHSCSFIATDDLGSLYDDGSFEVLGRMDNADVRGCSLLYM